MVCPALILVPEIPLSCCSFFTVVPCLLAIVERDSPLLILCVALLAEELLPLLLLFLVVFFYFLVPLTATVRRLFCNSLSRWLYIVSCLLMKDATFVEGNLKVHCPLDPGIKCVLYWGFKASSSLMLTLQSSETCSMYRSLFIVMVSVCAGSLDSIGQILWSQ